MKIISHRGLWTNQSEKNSMYAFEKAFSLGFGVETDVRDCCGDLVISHDMVDPNNKNILFEDFLKLYCKYKSKELTLAINIKADGLQSKIQEQLIRYDVKNYFVFDMSIPEMVVYSRMKIKFFTHQSEYCSKSILYDKAEGIWMDCFESIWYSKDGIKEHLNNDKDVCIVSADLHNRDNKDQWKKIKEILSEVDNEKLILCTDYPEKAKEYFYD